MCLDTDLCHCMDIHPHTLGSCEKPGKGALRHKELGFLSPGSRPRAARPGSRGMVLECSVQWLCLPGHPSGHLVIPLCQLLHTGMGGKGVLGTVRAVLIPLASPGQSLDRGTPVLGGMWEEWNGLLGHGRTPWCWSVPITVTSGALPSVPAPVGAPGCRMREGSRWRAGNPRSHGRWSGVAGIEHSWGSGQAGGFCTPSIQGYPEVCPEFLRVPGQRSHCTLQGQPAGNILIIPSAIPQPKTSLEQNSLSS